MEEAFPPLYKKPFMNISRPCTLVDLEGCILAWYLPGALTSGRQVGDPSHCGAAIKFSLQNMIWETLEQLQPLFNGGSNNSSWQMSNEFFKSPEACKASTPGAINLSLAWFEQAKEVRTFA